jgi:hypothetical protein
MLKVAARFNERIGEDGMSLLRVKSSGGDRPWRGVLQPQPSGIDSANNWARHDRMHAIDRMACYYVARGTRRGARASVTVERGRTHIHYELSNEDMWNLSRGLARLSSLLLQGGAVEVYPAVCGVEPIRTQVEAVRWLDDRLDGRACSLTTVHAFSSCPIGERRERCAADSFGRLHGLDNVYVNDASMIPQSGVNRRNHRRGALQRSPLLDQQRLTDYGEVALRPARLDLPTRFVKTSRLADGKCDADPA